jgi:hypothetical protein
MWMAWLALALTGACKDNDVKSAPPPGEVTPDVEAFRAALEADGFAIQEGTVGFIDIDECCDWVSCFKWNPTSDYGAYFIPLAPEESASHLVAGSEFAFRMRPDEAVVYVGPTVTDVNYFSFRSYVHERWMPEVEARVPHFLSLGDSINHTVIGTESGGPFGAETVVITVADHGIDRRVRAAAAGANYPEAWLNTDGVPPSVVELGLHDEADTLRMNYRVALWHDAEAREDFLTAPPGVVWRLTPIEPVIDLEPIPAPTVFRQPGTGVGESDLQPAVDALREALLEAFPAHEAIEADVNVREVDPDGDCWRGCNRDALESNTGPLTLADDPEDFVIAYGVNHQATGKAAYSNAILFGTDNDDPAALVDSSMMVGSARDYLGDHPDVDLLFAWTFSRNCDGAVHCSQVEAACPGMGMAEPGAIHFRAYLDPETGTHPLASETILDGAIRFKAPE